MKGRTICRIRSSSELVGKLRQYDTCALSNAIKRLEFRPRNEGFIAGNRHGRFWSIEVRRSPGGGRLASRLLHGRDFTPLDGQNTEQFVVLSETVARTYLRASDPIGTSEERYSMSYEKASATELCFPKALPPCSGFPEMHRGLTDSIEDGKRWKNQEGVMIECVFLTCFSKIDRQAAPEPVTRSH